MSDPTNHEYSDSDPTDEFHDDACERIDGEWVCSESCWWRFTGLDFSRGDLVVSVHPLGGRVVVTVSVKGDVDGDRTVEVAECSSVRSGLLLQQALLLLMRRKDGSDGDA